MDTAIKEAVLELTKNAIKEGATSNDALRLTQAALNLAHAGKILAE